VNGWPRRPFQIVSLLDLKKYRLVRLQNLALIQVGLFLNPVGGVTEFPKGTITAEHQTAFKEALDSHKDHLKYLRLDDAVSYLKLVRERLSNDGYTYQDYEKDVQALQDIQDIGLARIVTGFIPAHKVPYFHNTELFGKNVNECFPLAVEDIQSAGNCYAHGLYTACVFHLMRVVEVAARSMITHLKAGRYLVDRRGKRVPVELCDWWTLVTALQKGLDVLAGGTGTDKWKKRKYEHFNHAVASFRNFKDAWRNHVSHTREAYMSGQAKDILDITKGFMTHLANKPSRKT
jgi:hypothetical protein